MEYTEPSEDMNYLVLSENRVSLLRPGYITTARLILFFIASVTVLAVSLTMVVIALTIRNIEGPLYSVTSNLKNPESITDLMRVPGLIIMDGDCSSARGSTTYSLILS